MVESSPLPAVGNVVGVGTQLVGSQTLEMLAFAVENSHVRAEELVGGAGEKIAVEGAHVDGAVGSVVDGVDVAEGSGLPRQLDDLGDVVDGAGGIGRIAGGDEAGARANFFRQVLHVERAIGGVESRGADDDAFFFESL